MTDMRTLSTQKEIEAFLTKLRKRAGSVSPAIIASTTEIIKAVRTGGDAALKRLTKRFDGHDRIMLDPKLIKEAAELADRKTVRALKLAARRIKAFHARQKETTWQYREPMGIALGQIIRPLERVGVYVPGGTAAYPSTVLMNVIPAQVAGVPEIAVTVPMPGGVLNPYVMAALEIVGATEVYCVGGAQAVAAFAHGTRTIRPVDKIVGPGNVYVATAKRLVYGLVDIDMIAGPSEILVIADKTAEPSFVAADLLSQAEHDPLASSVLVTDSKALVDAVRKELERQLAELPRQKTARESLKNYGAIVLVSNMAEACDLSNRIAPEHLEVITKSPRETLKGLKNAGAIFLGPWTPEPIGDYAAGPNHTLPTGATSRWASPLGVYDFFKRTSLLEFSRKGFMSLADPVIEIAEREGLTAHARSVRIRKERG